MTAKDFLKARWEARKAVKPVHIAQVVGSFQPPPVALSPDVYRRLTKANAPQE